MSRRKGGAAVDPRPQAAGPCSEKDGISIRWVQSLGSNKALEFLNAGSLDFGLIACRELVPDLWDLCGHLATSLQELLDVS